MIKESKFSKRHASIEEYNHTHHIYTQLQSGFSTSQFN